MRALSILALLISVLGARGVARCHGEELRWSFDSVPPGSLVGNAALEPIGPTSLHFEGQPETNLALQLDGGGDYLRVKDNADYGSLDFQQDDPITIEAWVRLDRIASGQNAYVVGKGRTFLDGPRDNQNYALRLREVGGDARVSFLFRSADGDDHSSQWHRWTSKTGFAPDGSWHHVAISYKFGQPKSIRGYVDGTKVSGSWDMGGATEQPPVVDDDELWIGSSMGGKGGGSLAGALDDVAIHRKVVPAEVMGQRRIVISRPPESPSQGLAADLVNVSIYEGVGSHAAWPMTLPQPLVTYTQSAFGFARIPVPYGDGGVRRDWRGGAALMVAMAEVDLPQGDIQLMLRAGGLSRLWVGDAMVAETPVHLPNSNGHGEVDPYTEDDPWLRPLRKGHTEEIATFDVQQSGSQRVALETMIGGESLRHEAGEIIVGYRVDPSDQWQLLSFGSPTVLTDEAWAGYAKRHNQQLQQVDDRQRRVAAEVEDQYWAQRHRDAEKYIGELAPLAPSGSGDKSIDGFIDHRLAEAERSPANRSSDEQFLRRLYLDCVGVVPLPHEFDAFVSLDQDSKARRQKVIDLVLQDPRWADHWTAYWMDVLGENPNLVKPSLNNSGPFRWYLFDMMRDNVPVDRWVTGLLRMEGSVLEGGPAGFGIAKDNDVPMAAKAHVAASAFLGANMKCARCHDAPYHDWTQHDLFSLAAMMNRKPIKVPSTSSVPQDFFAGEEEGESIITLSVSPGQAIKSEWSLATYTTAEPVRDQDLAQSDDPREELAYQFTRVENRQFAKTIVNRLWQRLMGEGIVEPVDDWEGVEPSHPELLELLARELAANHFDLKHVARLILNSNAYQRRSVDRDVERDAEQRLFAGPRSRRMSAEQLVDSMHAAVGRAMNAGELTFDPEARMKPGVQHNLGYPDRAWQLTSLSNERDRPALTLPRAAAVTECLEAFGWSGERQEPVNHRSTDPNVIQPGILASGLLSIQLTRVTGGDGVETIALKAESAEKLVDELFRRFLTRRPTDVERQRFVDLLSEGFETRRLTRPISPETPIREPLLSWANHLNPTATEIRLREAERLRSGPEASRLLATDWRERLEDTIWALINTPEFQFIP